MDLHDPALRPVLLAVAEACRLARRVQQGVASRPLTKADLSPVTVADLAVQSFMACRLAEVHPQDPLVAEEDSSLLREPDGREALDRISEYLREFLPPIDQARLLDWIDTGHGSTAPRFWTLDPIDGTKGFLRGGQYAIALALIVDGKVELGILGCPSLTLAGARGDDPATANGTPGALALAQRGGGAWLTTLEVEQARRVKVSHREDPTQARVLRSVESGHTDVSGLSAVLEDLRVEAEPVLMDSQAKYAVLAAGEADLLLRLPSRPGYQEKIWDHAAGSIVVEEAGGRVTDVDGLPLDFTQGRTLAKNAGVIASNGALHDAALRSLARLRRR